MNEFDNLKRQYARDYLSHIKSQYDKYQRLQHSLAAVEYLGQPGGIRYDKPQVQTSPSPDAIPNAVIRQEEDFDLLSTLLNEVRPEIRDFEERMASLTTEGVVYLWLYYVKDLTWTEIAKTMNKDPKTIYNKRAETEIELYDTGLPFPYRLPNQPAEV